MKDALNHPIWLNHKIGNVYYMDGQYGWKIAYYPIFEDGKTGKTYSKPRVLVEREAKWGNITGTDFREVPIHYLSENNSKI